ncbi:RNA-directed DNA polymerase, eukaryota [Tanacetum coccineum]
MGLRRLIFLIKHLRSVIYGRSVAVHMVFDAWVPDFEDVDDSLSSGEAHRLLVISIYAPQELSEKRDLWNYLQSFISRWNGETVLMGDFKEVRSERKRFGSVFNQQGATGLIPRCISSRFFDSSFQDVMLSLGLHKCISKMSKLDRFLLSEGLFDFFPHLSAICLDKNLSDHRPILLRESCLDYGPTPFKFFHSWFSLDGFDGFECLPVLSQKAKIRWSIEGDENSKFFHGIINKKRAQLAISRHSMLDGNWISERRFVKDLESEISNEDSQSGWFGYCGFVNHTPVTTGYTFEFFRKYWTFIGNDIIQAVKAFFATLVASLEDAIPLLLLSFRRFKMSLFVKGFLVHKD